MILTKLLHTDKWPERCVRRCNKQATYVAKIETSDGFVSLHVCDVHAAELKAPVAQKGK